MQYRAVGTGPAGAAAAGPKFGACHENEVSSYHRSQALAVLVGRHSTQSRE